MARKRKPKEPIPGYVSVADAAGIIGVIDRRVRQLLDSGELDGAKVGERKWLVNLADAKRIAKSPAATGRPRGSQNKDAATT